MKCVHRSTEDVSTVTWSLSTEVQKTCPTYNEVYPPKYTRRAQSNVRVSTEVPKMHGRKRRPWTFLLPQPPPSPPKYDRARNAKMHGRFSGLWDLQREKRKRKRLFPKAKTWQHIFCQKSASGWDPYLSLSNCSIANLKKVGLGGASTHGPFSKPTCRPSGTTKRGEKQCWGTFIPFRLLSSDSFSSLIFFLFLVSSLFPPLPRHLSILSEVWLLNLLR